MNFRRSMSIAELWRPEVARRLKKIIFFVFFFGKTTPYGNIFKILFQKDSWPYRSTCCVQISWNLADGNSVKSCVAYLTTNSPGSPALATAWSILRGSRPKSARASPIYNVLRVHQISCKSIHFRWSYIQTNEHCRSAFESESNIRLKPTLKPNKYSRIQ